MRLTTALRRLGWQIRPRCCLRSPALASFVSSPSIFASQPKRQRSVWLPATSFVVPPALPRRPLCEWSDLLLPHMSSLLSLPALQHLDLSDYYLLSACKGPSTDNSSAAHIAGSLSPASSPKCRPKCRTLMLPSPHGEEATQYLTSLLETYVASKRTTHATTATATLTQPAKDGSRTGQAVEAVSSLLDEKTQVDCHNGIISPQSGPMELTLTCLKLPQRSIVPLERVAAAIPSLTSISNGPNGDFPTFAVSSFVPRLHSIHCCVTDDEAGVAARHASLCLFVTSFTSQLRIVDITFHWTTPANLELLSCVFACRQLVQLSLLLGNHNI